MPTINSIDVLFPPLQDRSYSFHKELSQYGLFCFETFRSFDSQMEKYKQGRSLVNGIWKVIN